MVGYDLYPFVALKIGNICLVLYIIIMITSISNNNLISDTISDKDIQTKKVKKRDRKEFLETRTRY